MRQRLLSLVRKVALKRIAPPWGHNFFKRHLMLCQGHFTHTGHCTCIYSGTRAPHGPQTMITTVALESIAPREPRQKLLTHLHWGAIFLNATSCRSHERGALQMSNIIEGNW